MRHDHPRGDPNTTYWRWCRACVTQGITTAEEICYVPPPRRGRIKVGMTVRWFERRSNPTGLIDPGFDELTGQVWSLAENPKDSWYSKNHGTYWWVVRDSGKAYKVNQEHLHVVEEEK